MSALYLLPVAGRAGISVSTGQVIEMATGLRGAIRPSRSTQRSAASVMSSCTVSEICSQNPPGGRSP